MSESLCAAVGTSESGCNERYLLGRVHCDASGTTDARRDVRCEESHSLRWRLSPPSVPVSDRIQASRRHAGAGRPTESPLQHRRDAAVAALPHDPRARTDRDHAVAAAQWRVPVPHRSAELSRGPDAPPEDARPARPLSAPDGGPPATPVPGDLRYRLDRPGRLRPSGTGSNRLQPHQAGTPLVSPLALLRGTDEGLL